MAFVLIIIIAALIGADQAVKLCIDHNFEVGESKSFIAFGDFRIFDLTYVRNEGAIFGSMSGHRWFLIGFTAIAIIAGIFILFRYMRRSKMLTLALVLFISGGIGNLIDRIRLGYVVDMFDFQLFEFAVFNVADILVVAAIICLFIYVFFIDSRIDEADKASSPKEKAAENE